MFRSRITIGKIRWTYPEIVSNPSSANISCFPRRLEDVFSETPFVFQKLLKTSSRRLQYVLAIRLPKTSSRRLQDIFNTCLQEVLQLCLQDVLEDKKCYTEDVFSTSSPKQMFAGSKLK